ncbi:MAG: hydrogenase small subunit [Coriobacteriia bacterium]|nr:hydrogenase small subunit [Coriobacteriia bacterium]
MLQEKNATLNDALIKRGVTRRDFMKYCGTLAIALGLAESAAPQIAAAVEAGAKLKPVIWLEAGSCSGCTESMAQVGSPDIATVVLELLSIEYSETLMAGAGHSAEAAKKALVEKGGYFLIYEGSVMTGWDGNALRIAGEKGTDQLLECAKNADAVIAVGSCAVDGGWVAAAPNPGGATGVSAFLKKSGVNKPVINLPTCPVNPEWVVAVVVDALLIGKLPELDEQGRPKLIFGSTIHDNCPRRGHFENGEFVDEFGTEAEVKGWCLYKVGCKGPQTYTNCPVVRWNEGASWCVESGAPCIGCGQADAIAGGKGNWVDANAPFFARTNDVRLPGIGGVQPGTIGAVVGAAAAAGIAVHGVATAASGRFSGAPLETEKAYDRKKASKGGDK